MDNNVDNQPIAIKDEMSLQSLANSGQNKRAAKVSHHPNGPNHGDLSEEIARMADTSQYNDSAPADKTEQTKNTWKPLGDLARALIEKAVAK